MDLLNEHISERKKGHGKNFEPIFPQRPLPFDREVPENEVKGLAAKVQTDFVKVFVPKKDFDARFSAYG